MVFTAPLHRIVPIVACASLLFLAALGAVGAKAGGANIPKAMVRVPFWGAFAMAVTAGGPGSSGAAPLRRFDAALEDHFVMVYWDQRYAGQSFDETLRKPAQLTIRQYVDDLGVVVDRLRARFGRDRVGILAHAWGTVPGILYAAQNPQKLYAYVGVGQAADVPEPAHECLIYRRLEPRLRPCAWTLEAGARPFGRALHRASQLDKWT